MIFNLLPFEITCHYITMILYSERMVAVTALQKFFGEVHRMIKQAERRYGIANLNLTEYIIILTV